MLMQRLALCIAVLGIFVLIGLLAFARLEEVTSLNETIAHQRVIVRGVVASERSFGNSKIIAVNGLEILCDCAQTFRGKNVTIIGSVDDFNEKKRVVALEIYLKYGK